MPALLFDFGGTLIDQDLFLNAARNAAVDRVELLRREGHIDGDARVAFGRISAEVWAEHQGLIPSVKEKLIKRETISRFMSRLNMPPDGSMIDEVYSAYIAGAVECPCVFPGVTGLLEELSGSYQLAIVSNGLADYTWQFLDRHGLTRFFAVRLISEETNTEKPDASIFRQAMDALGTGPGDTVMVGNMLYEDILGARNAGVRSVWLDRKEKQRVNDVKADFRITDIRQLPSVLHQVFPGGGVAG